MCYIAALQRGQSRNILRADTTRYTQDGGKKFQQLVYVKYKIDEFKYLLDVMNSVCDQVQQYCLNKLQTLFIQLSFFQSTQ